MADSRYLLVGLGNPGPEYQSTRHNAGFILLEYIADHCSCLLGKSKMDGLFCQQRAFDAQIIALQPQTYMNRSGVCVRRFMDFFSIPEQNLLVIHDDIDMQVGRVKIVAGGGPGGHNGIKSIIQHLGTRQFARIKYGVGRPDDNRQPVDKFVLSRFTSDELQCLEDRRDLVLHAVETFVRKGIDRCMNETNGLTS